MSRLTAPDAVPDAPESAPADTQLDGLVDEFVFALGAEFPELRAADVLVSPEPGGAFARVDWDGWSALFPRTEDAAVQLELTASVMPHLRGFVSPAVPLWERSGGRDELGGRWHAARTLEGNPLRTGLIVEQNRERLVRDLASFCHELHGFSVERARSLGVASFRAWREEHEALSREALSIMRPLVSWSRLTWARRWWRRFLEDDSLWRMAPSLVHGGLAEERLLVDPLAQQLSAVTGWHGLRVGDPASDFAQLVDVYGSELGWRIVEHYEELGSTADASLFRRVRLLQTVERFRELVAASDRDGAESEAVASALERLG